MNHNKKKYKRANKKRKRKNKRKAKRAPLYTSVPETVVDDVTDKYTKLYESVFFDEILPYGEYLKKYGVREIRTAVRVTSNPAEPSNFISKREISLEQMARNEGEVYLSIPPKPEKMTKRKVLNFLSERGLSHFVNFEMADEAMNKLYKQLVSSYGREIAEEFFEQRGRYLVEMRYDENVGWFLPTNSSGHFDLVRETNFDYSKYITDNYRELNIPWQGKD